MIALRLVMATRTGALSTAIRRSTMLRITIHATLIVILATGAASAQYDPWRTPKHIDRAYQSTIERLPDPKKKQSDPWADPQLTPSGAATTPSAGAKQTAGTLEHPGQQRIRCFGARGVLCAPTAHQTNGLIGVSPETE